MHAHRFVFRRVAHLHDHRLPLAGFEGEAGGAAEFVEGPLLDAPIQREGAFFLGTLAARNLLSRPPHRGWSDRGSASGSITIRPSLCVRHFSTGRALNAPASLPCLALPLLSEVCFIRTRLLRNRLVCFCRFLFLLSLLGGEPLLVTLLQ